VLPPNLLLCSITGNYLAAAILFYSTACIGLLHYSASCIFKATWSRYRQARDHDFRLLISGTVSTAIRSTHLIEIANSCCHDCANTEPSYLRSLTTVVMPPWRPRPNRRRVGKHGSRNPTFTFRFIAAALVLSLYFIIQLFRSPSKTPVKEPSVEGAKIQWAGFEEGKGSQTRVDKEHAQAVVEAMKHTFWHYKQKAWGSDDIKPISGEKEDSRNAWGAFIVDSASTLAIMGLWDELELCIKFILSINFTVAKGNVDPFETTIRYLGGLVSLVELIDSGIVSPANVPSSKSRDAILARAVTLANALAPAYDTPTGMPWPLVNFATATGLDNTDDLSKTKENSGFQFKNSFITPARTGSAILENRALSRLTNNPIYLQNATRAWSPLVWSKYSPPAPGMVHSPWDIDTGAPLGRRWGWDTGHDSYYEYLLKSVILAPSDKYSPHYISLWIDSALSLRSHLGNRAAESENHPVGHMYMGSQDDMWFLNAQTHLACFAPGNLMLGYAYLTEKRRPLLTFAQALLEGCRHAYNSSSTGIGPENWSWAPKYSRKKTLIPKRNVRKLSPSDPMTGDEEIVTETRLAQWDNMTFAPKSQRQQKEWKDIAIWHNDPRYLLRPEYVESLFYGFRITGNKKYREWAWDAFSAIEKNCKVEFGYAGLEDVMRTQKSRGEVRHIDRQESFWTAETLKYLFLIFEDVERASLNRWVFTTEGHLLRMIR
jgi:mannosyl-oligosaccharide alpha-1,2-mannosidase